LLDKHLDEIVGGVKSTVGDDAVAFLTIEPFPRQQYIACLDIRHRQEATAIDRAENAYANEWWRRT